MSKVNTITIDNVVMGHSINNDIVDFIKSKNFTQAIIFTQQAVQDSSKILIDQLIMEHNAELFILDDGENSKDISSAMKQLFELKKKSV